MGALFGAARSSNNAIVEGIVDSQAQFRIEKGLNDASKAIYSQNEYLFLAFKAFCSISMCLNTRKWAEITFIREIERIKVIWSFLPFLVEIGDFDYILDLYYRKVKSILETPLVVL